MEQREKLGSLWRANLPYLQWYHPHNAVTPVIKLEAKEQKTGLMKFIHEESHCMGFSQSRGINQVWGIARNAKGKFEPCSALWWVMMIWKIICGIDCKQSIIKVNTLCFMKFFIQLNFSWKMAKWLQCLCAFGCLKNSNNFT